MYTLDLKSKKETSRKENTGEKYERKINISYTTLSYTTRKGRWRHHPPPPPPQQPTYVSSKQAYSKNTPQQVGQEAVSLPEANNNLYKIEGHLWTSCPPTVLWGERKERREGRIGKTRTRITTNRRRRRLCWPLSPSTWVRWVWEGEGGWGGERWGVVMGLFWALLRTWLCSRSLFIEGPAKRLVFDHSERAC